MDLNVPILSSSSSYDDSFSSSSSCATYPSVKTPTCPALPTTLPATTSATTPAIIPSTTPAIIPSTTTATTSDSTLATLPSDEDYETEYFKRTSGGFKTTDYTYFRSAGPLDIPIRQDNSFCDAESVYQPFGLYNLNNIIL